MTDDAAPRDNVTNELVEALANAQGEFPPIEKKATATVQGKDGKQGYSYKYADIGDVLAVVRPVLSKHGLAVLQRTVPTGGGKANLVTELRHKAGGIVTTEVELGQSSGNPQQFGGALTYLRRYELVTLLGIAAEEDRDAQDVAPAPRQGNGRPAELPPWARPATDARKAELVAALAPLVGRDGAVAIGAGVGATLGHVPDVVVATAKLIAGELAPAFNDAELERLRERVVEARAVRADRPREEEDPARQPTPEEIEAERQAAERRDAERAQDAAEEGDEPPAEDGPGETAAGYGGGPEEDAPVDTVPGPDGTDEPAPGTIDPPPLADHPNDEEAIKALVGAGCICDVPTAEKDAPGHNDRCPIKGHGIPF